MRFPAPLVPAILLRRYKRFLADVRFDDGREETAHCPNPGAMRGCSEPGRPVLLSVSDDPRRKYRYGLEMIRIGRTWVGVNPQRANRIVGRLLASDRIVELAGFRSLRPEAPSSGSRIDFLLTDARDGGPDCWVEVKSTTWRVPGGERHAAFPDAVTARGRRHLETLTERVRAGQRAAVFFHVARDDVRRFRPADEVDPAYGDALRTAATAGVEVFAYRFRHRPDTVSLAGRLSVDL